MYLHTCLSPGLQVPQESYHDVAIVLACFDTTHSSTLSLISNILTSGMRLRWSTDKYLHCVFNANSVNASWGGGAIKYERAPLKALSPNEGCAVYRHYATP